jgi:hypothetical protein
VGNDEMQEPMILTLPSKFKKSPPQLNIEIIEDEPPQVVSNSSHSSSHNSLRELEDNHDHQSPFVQEVNDLDDYDQNNNNDGYEH